MDRIAKEAFAQIKEQTVPLVVHKPDGTRIVIGEATVKGDDEGLKILSTKIEDEKYNDILKTNIKEFSISVKVGDSDAPA